MSRCSRGRDRTLRRRSARGTRTAAVRKPTTLASMSTERRLAGTMTRLSIMSRTPSARPRRLNPLVRAANASANRLTPSPILVATTRGTPTTSSTSTGAWTTSGSASARIARSRSSAGRTAGSRTATCRTPTTGTTSGARGATTGTTRPRRARRTNRREIVRPRSRPVKRR